MEYFEEQLVKLFNQSALPLEAKRYVIIKFMRDVEDLYQQAKKQQKVKVEETEQKNEKEIC